MPDLATLILHCAMAVHPETVQAIIQHESRGNPYALNTQVRSHYPSNREEAGRLLMQAIREGRSIDIGLMQVNTQWLDDFDISAEALFEPCTNIRIGTTILQRNYEATWAKYRAEKPALLGALSMYNTGNERAGIRNGYVGKVARQVGVQVQLAEGAEGAATAQATAVPMVHPRTAPTGFSETGPEAYAPPPDDPLLPLPGPGERSDAGFQPEPESEASSRRAPEGPGGEGDSSTEGRKRSDREGRED